MSAPGTVRLPITVTLCKNLKIMATKVTNSQSAPGQEQSTVRSERKGSVSSPKPTKKLPRSNCGFTSK
jgi:hypothetical protein